VAVLDGFGAPDLVQDALRACRHDACERVAHREP
jgi:hypothetical protein